MKRKVGITGSIIAAIITGVVTVEGGYVNNPFDPGGETNHGVTVQVARDAGYTGSMKDLTVDQAKEIYANEYVYKVGFDGVVELSPAVGEKIIDAGVNAGTGRSSRWFQTSLNALNRGGKDYPPIHVDGKIGAGTVAAYASLQKVRGKVKACELTLKLMDAQQATHYMSLTKLNTFTVGWVDHRIGNVPLSKCKEG
jgi:lysozyme family protein